MDADRFDRLARSVGGIATRRSLLAAIATLVAPVEAWAKKRGKKGQNKKKKKCKPKCGGCQKCVKGKCRKGPDGKKCAGGRCRGGVCFGAAGGCAVSDGNALSQLTEGTFQGKALRAAQTVQPFAGEEGFASEFDVTLAGKPLLTIATESAGQVVTVTVTYGDAFKGVNRARITNDGTTLSGDIDGRAIAPLAVDADPSSLTFADGSPLPDINVDPQLAAAVEQLMKQAEQSAGSCELARRGRKGARGANGRAHPENSAGCLALYLPCQAGYVGCLAGVGGGCVLAFLGYGVCVAIGVAACFYASMQCRKSIRYSETCCPVRCGGSDVFNVFGEDPLCCEKGESCLDPNSNETVCCPPGSSNCSGTCCPNGRCLNGSCCEPPNGICGNQCCAGGFGSCCGNQCCTGTCCGGSICCPGICNGGVCCNPGSAPCGSGCCSTVCCNGTCCPSGYACQGGQCVQVCQPGQTPCFGQCCPPGQDCYQCPNGAHICAGGPCIN